MRSDSCASWLPLESPDHNSATAALRTVERRRTGRSLTGFELRDKYSSPLSFPVESFATEALRLRRAALRWQRRRGRTIAKAIVRAAPGKALLI